VEAFPGAIFCGTTLPKAVDWVPVPSLRTIADTLGNAVTFLPTALRGGTRTFFSSQGTTNLFFLKGQNMEVTDKGSSQTPLTAVVETARLVGAQAPFVTK
jgi:hypothetical protein